VSRDGSRIVGRSDGLDGGIQAFVWDEENGMQALDEMLVELGLDLSGWTLLSANAISADGRTIVGAALNPLGLEEAFVAFVPEPTLCLLLAFASLRLGGLTRPSAARSDRTVAQGVALHLIESNVLR